MPDDSDKAYQESQAKHAQKIAGERAIQDTFGITRSQARRLLTDFARVIQIESKQQAKPRNDAQDVLPIKTTTTHIPIKGLGSRGGGAPPPAGEKAKNTVIIAVNNEGEAETMEVVIP